MQSDWFGIHRNNIYIVYVFRHAGHEDSHMIMDHQGCGDKYPFPMGDLGYPRLEFYIPFCGDVLNENIVSNQNIESKPFYIGYVHTGTAVQSAQSRSAKSMLYPMCGQEGNINCDVSKLNKIDLVLN